MSGEDRAKVEAALSDLKSALSADDKDAIERKSEALAQAASGLMQQAHGAEAAAGGAGARLLGTARACLDAMRSGDIDDSGRDTTEHYGCTTGARLRWCTSRPSWSTTETS